MAGLLCLNGGEEFRPGNEPQDELLRDAAAGRPALILATAVADAPEMALRTAQGWFSGMSLAAAELRVRTRGEATAAETAHTAARAGLFYLAGGDPGRVVRVLRASLVWEAMVTAWRSGAALAGSSAGAMALCEWTLIRQSFPGHTRRRPEPALNVVPGTALLPHFNTFGERWIPSAQEALGAKAVLLGVEERTAALWRDGVWRVFGRGAVTVVHGATRMRFHSGDAIEGLPQPSADRDPPLRSGGVTGREDA